MVDEPGRAAGLAGEAVDPGEGGLDAGVDIAEGALFYGEPRRRAPVVFDAELRRLTIEVAASARAQIAASVTPPAVYDKRKA